ncbi:MAG TPA: hypothetical protein VFC63_06970 [Blastocatellia bacterium]|nr:hypothetical protein [Blastocatellia bacterium]
MSPIHRSAVILFIIVSTSIFGIAQQGKKPISLDNEDLSPYGGSTDVVNAGKVGWAQVNPEAGRFSVMMPGTVLVGQRPLSVPSVGTLTTHIYQAEDGGREYIAYYVDYPYVLPESMIEIAYDSGRNNMLSTSNVTVLSESTIKSGEYTGRQMLVKEETHKGYLQMFLVRNRLYVLFCDNGASDKISDDTKKFLSSFKITAE